MTPFGFTPGNSDDSNEPVDFAAMMQQMQQQIQEQFSKLGINASGFGGSTFGWAGFTNTFLMALSIRFQVRQSDRPCSWP